MQLSVKVLTISFVANFFNKFSLFRSYTHYGHMFNGDVMQSYNNNIYN